MTATSGFLLRHFQHRRAIERRRHLYEAYLRAIGETQLGRAFEPLLEPGNVPYVFPYLLNHPEATFDSLWDAGIPLYRWEDVAVGSCSVSAEFRERLIQFPCHQELSDKQVAWLLATARSVLRPGRKSGTPPPRD